MKFTKHARAIHLIKQMIRTLDVDLKNQVVLTEVGTNNYLYTPIIAALCGAKKVYAWTRDTAYGEGHLIYKECMELASYLGIEQQIEIAVNHKPVEHVNEANVITNSGFLRPLDSAILDQANHQSCVIPLMYEAWELRESDLDINYCRKHNIKVAGTWENHPSIGVFDGVGPLAVKLSLEAGYEVYQNNIIVWSRDDFGRRAVDCFQRFGANKVTMTSDVAVFWQEIEDADFVYFCDYHEQRMLLGNNGLFDLQKLSEINPVVGFVHLYGQIDNDMLKSHQLKVYPDKPGKSEVMTESLAYLGERPVVNLQVAGFKVAQCMLDQVEHPLVQHLSGSTTE